MKKIIGILQPFDIYQTFFVYENGNKIDYTKVRMTQIPDIIFALASEYETNQVDLAGSEHYIKGIIKQIKEKEMEKYHQNKLVITCI